MEYLTNPIGKVGIWLLVWALLAQEVLQMTISTTSRCRSFTSYGALERKQITRAWQIVLLAKLLNLVKPACWEFAVAFSRTNGKLANVASSLDCVGSEGGDDVGCACHAEGVTNFLSYGKTNE